MNRIKNSLVAFGGLSLLVGAIALVTPRSSYGTPPNEKEVLVVNTAAKPVPVTALGTTEVAGSVSIINTPDVNIASTPTVRLALDGDDLPVAQRGPKLIQDSGVIEVASGFRDIHVDVSSFTKVRVFGINFATSDGTASLSTNASLPGGVIVPFDDFPLSPGGRFTQTYDVAGSTLVLRVGTGSRCDVRLWVYGS